MEIFELASKTKLRFSLNNGVCNTEDLWDLKLEDLNRIAIDLNKQIKESEEESFIKVKSSASKLLQLGFDVVKRVIDVKLEEKETKKLAAERASRKALLTELIAKKELSSLEQKSLEELQKELAEI